MRLIINKQDYHKASFPMELVCLDKGMGFDFLFSEARKIDDSIFTETYLGEVIFIDFDTKDLIRIAKRFIAV